MATSKKEPPNPGRDRPTRTSTNFSSVPSSGYGARRARSMPGSPDRLPRPSAAAVAAAAASGSLLDRPPLSVAGRSSSSRSIYSKPSYGASSKPTLARAKSEKVTATSHRPTPASNSSTLLKSKLAQRAAAASSSTPVRGGRTMSVYSASRSTAAATKKRAEATIGGAPARTGTGRAKSSPRASAPKKEKEEETPLHFDDETDSISDPSIEDHLHEQLPDPVDLLPTNAPALEQPFPDHLEQQSKIEEEVVAEHLEKENVGTDQVHDGGQDADESGTEKTDAVQVADEPEEAKPEKVVEQAKPEKVASPVSRPEVVQSWRKDDPKSNDVIEETKSKLLEERKSRVRALVGAFETVMSKD